MYRLFFSLLAGALLVLAFAPFNLYAFAFISPAILFYVWLQSKPLAAFWQGLLFGLGFFGVGVSWVFISINTYGNTPFIISVLITLMMIMFFALYPATQGLVVRWLFKSKSHAVLCLTVFPASWILWELLRSFLLTGFPWLLLGTSQLNTPLQGLIPIIGVFGVSLAVVMISGCLTLLGFYTGYGIKIICVLIIIAIAGLGWSFKDHLWTYPSGAPLKVSLIQGNIPQEIKWDPNQISKTLDIYLKLTEQSWNSQLIVWPEAAVPEFPQQAPEFIANLKSKVKMHHVSLIFGAPIYDNDTKQFYNALILLSEKPGIYAKRHLVPFGEYFPLQKMFSWFLNYFQIPMSNFSPGPENQPNLNIDHTNLATFICYESAFPFEVLKYSRNKNLIITISDDSWFGESIALAQHLQMAQMRALETGRSFLQATNTGLTAIVNPFGKITAMAPIGKQYILQGTITPMSGSTPLMKWNYIPVYGFILALLLISFLG